VRSDDEYGYDTVGAARRNGFVALPEKAVDERRKRAQTGWGGLRWATIRAAAGGVNMIGIVGPMDIHCGQVMKAVIPLALMGSWC